MDPTTTALLAVIAAVAALATTLEILTRRREPDHGTDARSQRTGFVDADDGLEPASGSPRPPPTYRLFEVSELLNADHLRGMDAIEGLLHDVADAVRGNRKVPRRRPRRPTSILLHGPPGGAMMILAHALARRLRARLVQVFASRCEPFTNGGSQPVIAVAVNEARHHLPSVLVLDELEAVAGAGVKDVAKQRAANDLFAESLRPVYGPSHVVLGAFVTYDDAPVPRRIADLFEHTIRVDVPELERALMMVALRTADSDLFRTISGVRIAERGDATWWRDSAA